jgi:hypothetical protein
MNGDRPTADEVSIAVVTAARITWEDVVEVVTGGRGSRARVYAHVALCVAFPKADRSRMAGMLGAQDNFEQTLRQAVKTAKWFDVGHVRDILARLGAKPRVLSLRDCIEATYSLTGDERVMALRRPRPEPRTSAPTAAASNQRPEEKRNEDAQFAVRLTSSLTVAANAGHLIARRPRVSQEIIEATSLNRIPSTAERLAFARSFGLQMVVIRGSCGEPSFERSALAHRLRNPLREEPVVELKPADQLYLEGYDCARWGDDEAFPAYLAGKGKDFRLGWLAGFAERRIAPEEASPEIEAFEEMGVAAE